jgi:hypothetical protein
MTGELGGSPFDPEERATAAGVGLLPDEASRSPGRAAPALSAACRPYGAGALGVIRFLRFNDAIGQEVKT